MFYSTELFIKKRYENCIKSLKQLEYTYTNITNMSYKLLYNFITSYSPLGIIWTASYLRESELHKRRKQIVGINVADLVGYVQNPPVALALPTQGVGYEY